jgi:serine/threonine protein kinase
VTELMTGGSLEDVLHDPKRDLLWPARESIALQVALGMEHLHNKQLLHRDLKSANVLLDKELNAKVCDFGMARIVRPPRRQVVRSAFTGVTRVMPAAGGSTIFVDNLRKCPLSMARISFLDAHGTMTKAQGTMLWMAPEVFRGDMYYTKAVDV